MKQTVQINIGQRLFTIDEDAYQRLSAYLDSLSQYFGNNPEGNEIVEDIEYRIADLLSERDGSDQSVSLEDVNNVIDTMGTPQEMDSEEALTDDQAAAYPVASKKLVRIMDGAKIAGVCNGIADFFDMDVSLVRIIFVLLAIGGGGFGVVLYIILWIILPVGQKSPWNAPRQKLYRDPDDKILGGVLSGFAEYFGYKTSTVRAIFMIPYILFGLKIMSGPFGIFGLPFLGSIVGTMTLIYILLWIFVPEASTPMDRMQMKGEPINVNTIKDNIYNNPDNTQSTSANDTASSNVSYNSSRPSSTSYSNTSSSSSSKSSSSSSNSTGIGRALGIIFEVGVILMMFIVFCGIIAVLIGIKTSGIDLSDIQDFVFSSNAQKVGYYIALAILLISPILTVAYFIMKRKDPKNPSLRTMSVLVVLFWIGAVVSIFSMFGSFAMDFRTQVSSSSKSNFNIPGDTLYVKYRNYNNYEIDYSTGLDNIIFVKGDRLYVYAEGDLDVEPSNSDSYELDIKKTSNGSNAEKCKDRIDNISYNTQLQGDTLFIDRYLSISKPQIYRGQRVNLTVKAPQGTNVISENDGIDIDYDRGMLKIHMNDDNESTYSMDVDSASIDVRHGDQDIEINVN